MPSLTRLTSEHPLTKTVSLKDGVLKKQLATPMTKGTAERVSFNTFAELAHVWLSLNKNQAFVHGDYDLKSNKVNVVTDKELNGQKNTISRTQDHFSFTAPNTFLLDYDPKGKALDGKALLAALCSVFPGFEGCGYVARKSTGAEIYNGSDKVADSDGLHFVFVAKDGSNIKDFGKRLSQHLWLAGYGRIEISESGQMLERVLIDVAVFTPERIHFAAGANCKKPLVQKLPKPRIVEGAFVDTSALPEVDASGQIAAAKRAAEPLAKKKRAKYRSVQIKKLDCDNAAEIVDARMNMRLLPDDVLTFDDFGVTSVSDVLADPGKYDNATLNDPLENVKGKAMFFANALQVHSFLHGKQLFKLCYDFDAACAAMQAGDGRNWQTILARSHLSATDCELYLKKVKTKIGVALKTLRDDLTENTESLSHGDMARKYVEQFDHVTFADGKLWNCDGVIWEMISFEAETVAISEMFNDQARCQRGGDYRQIANHANAIKNDPEFFQGAPDGVACGTTFYHFEDDELKSEALTPEHRQRFVLPVTPVAEPPTWLLSFLHDCFKGHEPENQTALVQEIFGTILLGTMYTHEKVAMFIGKGNSGKSTLLRILEGMIPEKFRCAVSPEMWDQPYYLATLAGMRLNSVGEIGKKFIGSQFKTATGRDLLQARNPYERPFTFRAQVGHVFNTNQLPNTYDISTAFFRRWIIVVFDNSREKIANENIVDLDTQILEDELGKIVHWSLLGGQRVKEQNRFTGSKMSDDKFKRWTAASDGVSAFIEDEMEVSEKGRIDTGDFNRRYREYCHEEDYEALTTRKLRERMEQLGYRQVSAGKKGRLWCGVTWPDDEF